MSETTITETGNTIVLGEVQDVRPSFGPGVVIRTPDPVPLVLDLGSDEPQPDLSESDARQLTAEIQRTSVRLWLLVTEAHDRSAHKALGYQTWDDYARVELKMSPSRSYQLLDTGHVMRELAVAGADIDRMQPPPTRVVAKLKSRLPEVRRAAEEAVRTGESPDKALRALARQAEAPAPPDVGPADSEAGGDDDVGEAAGADEQVAASTEQVPEPGNYTCPACAGRGKVSRSMAAKLRNWVKAQAA